MTDSIVSRQQDGTYKVTQNGRKFANGKTQQKAANNAAKKKPNDPILAQRQRDTANGKRDQLRRIYPT